MKRVFVLLLLLGCLGARAQVRSYADNAAGTFVVGLDSYFYGNAGSLQFQAGGQDFTATIADGQVLVNGVRLDGAGADTVIGIHDFTEDRVPELVVGLRTDKSVSISIFRLQGGRWEVLKQMSAVGATEARVFRQVVSVRQGDVLSSWTWRGGRFEFKSSDGSPEPSLP